VDTRALANGTHTFAAIASDAAGNSSQAAISIVVNNVVDLTAPTITITAPTDGAKVSTNTAVKVDTGDNVGVSKVELYVDGTLQGVSTSAPFSIKWNSSKAAKGAHAMQCKAYDAAGNTGLSQLLTVTK
jgi:chitinase